MDQPVRINDTIRLKHSATARFLSSKRKLHSHSHSSKQQVVFAKERVDSSTDWIVVAPFYYEADELLGERIKDGDLVRLIHADTRRTLHSHSNHPAPITPNQQEITACGKIDRSDVNDDWRVQLFGQNEWTYGEKVHLVHVRTGATLHSHARPDLAHLDGNNEVTGFRSQSDINDDWCAERARRRTLPFSKARQLQFLNVLNVLGSIASISGWTLLTLKGVFGASNFSLFVATVLTVGLWLATATILFQLSAAVKKRLEGRYRTLISPIVWQVFWISSLAGMLLFIIHFFLASLQLLSQFISWALRITPHA